MGIGTSLGAFYETRFDQVREPYDNNVIDPDAGGIHDKSKDAMTQPIPISDKLDSFISTLNDYRGMAKGNARMEGLIDEVSSFARTFRNAKKATGQN